MSRTLHTSSSAVQLPLTAFLAGVVVGQVVIGPVSDSLGRRGLLIGGCAGFALVALACAFAAGIGTLIAARFLLGFVGAAGMVLARAVITDRFHGPEVPRHFALLSQIMSVAPVAAPVIGGAILSLSTWRAVFGALCFAGVRLLVAVLVKVPESLPPERRQRGGLVGTFHAMGRLTHNRPFMGCALVLGLASAALFSYISDSSFVFERIHGTSPALYSLIFAVNAVGMLLAGALFSRLSLRMRVNTLLTAATDIKKLAGKVVRTPYTLMSPITRQSETIMLSAWGHQLSVDTASDPRVEQFITAYVQGPQTPEPGAPCTGGLTGFSSRRLSPGCSRNLLTALPELRDGTGPDRHVTLAQHTQAAQTATAVTGTRSCRGRQPMRHHVLTTVETHGAPAYSDACVPELPTSQGPARADAPVTRRRLPRCRPGAGGSLRGGRQPSRSGRPRCRSSWRPGE
ncbi:MFS transporter [Streptomyces sporangiiformans]|nr:MFS transporter [Streptomyces sporangiiformans]